MKAVEMQQPSTMFPVMHPHPSANITTEQIQKYLDENKKLILAILDNQNLGKLAECAQYQAVLQKNLMYLAAIADAQPQTPSMPPQVTAHPTVQPGGFYMQHPQAAAMVQQSGMFPPRTPFAAPHPLQDPSNQLSQNSLSQGQMAAWPTGANSPMLPNPNQTNPGGSSIVTSSNSRPIGNSQDKPEVNANTRSVGAGSLTVIRGSTDGGEAN